MRALAALIGVLLTATLTLAQDYTAPGEFEVAITDKSWTDASRQDREVPVRIYAPKDDPAKLPIVIFSHGLGGSREHYVYFGRHMASHGYLCVHVQHRGSDTGSASTAARSVPQSTGGQLRWRTGSW